MPKQIMDEFTDLPISRQRKWILRHRDWERERRHKRLASNQFMRYPRPAFTSLTPAEYSEIKRMLKQGKSRSETAKSSKRSYRTVTLIEQSQSFGDYKQITREAWSRYKTGEPSWKLTPL